LPNRALPLCPYGDIDMNTAPTLGKAAAIAATGPTKAAAAPRIKLWDSMEAMLVTQMVSVHVMTMR
jgi:hypothetical protein